MSLMLLLLLPLLWPMPVTVVDCVVVAGDTVAVVVVGASVIVVVVVATVVAFACSW